MNFDLTKMSVSALLMVGDHGNLNHERANQLVTQIFEGNFDPTSRFAEFFNFDFLEVVKVGSAAHGDLGGGVTLVKFEVRVDGEDLLIMKESDILGIID